MVRVFVLLGLLALAACADAFNQPASIPGGRPLWQNAPSNATYEAPGSRPR